MTTNDPVRDGDLDADIDDGDDGDDEGLLDNPWVRRIGYVVGALALIAALFVGFLVTVMFEDLLSAVIYWTLFWVGLLWLPTTVFLAAPMFTNGLRKLFGVGYFYAGQFAFGGSCLVQHEDEYHLCPLEDGNVYYDGEWWDVDLDHNTTILGWQPFATWYVKDENSFDHARADPTVADGGTRTLGGYEITDREPDGDEDTILLDLSRYYTEGLKALGDVDMLEKEEEITEREQTGDGRFGGYEPILATITGLLIGVATGYVAFGGF